MRYLTKLRSESDLLAFELAIERGHPGSVMCAYNKVNGPYACGNSFLLNHETLTVSFTVRNDGRTQGKDAPQIYLTAAAGKALRRLVGFTKVELNPNAATRVFLTVEPRLLADFDVKKQRWHVAAGQYRVAVGASPADLSLTSDARIRQSWLKP